MIAHLDCSSGISGDKFLGAVLDAGFSADTLRDALASLGIAPESVIVEKVLSRGISATSVRLAEHLAVEPLPMRRLADIQRLLDRGSLADGIASRALGVFTTLAEAEAHVHGTDVDEVHFHEIGAFDTILDVVGVTLGLDALGIDTVTATPPALGSGTVQTSHGVLPVPAPATAQILIGIPVSAGSLSDGDQGPGELTTPTGAALVRTFAASFGPFPAMITRHIGYGAGTRDIGSPNVARLSIGEQVPSETSVDETFTEALSLIETNIDHLTAEQLAFSAEQLLAEGALDVWQTPITMKKGRSAVTLSLMCAPDDAPRLQARVHALTGTLGVRRQELTRSVVPREQEVVDTRYGPVRFKVARINGGERARPEHEDVARIARETGKALPSVAEDLMADAARALDLS